MSGTLELAARDRRIDGIFKDIGRYGASIWCLYLYYSGGLTLPRLKEVCARSKILSPGRARALLIYLQLLGYVKALPKNSSGPTQYLPNPSLMAAIKAQATLGLEGLAVIDSNFQTVVDHFHEPEIFRTFIVHYGEGALNTSIAVDHNVDFLGIFATRYAGMQLLHLMLLSADEAHPDSGGRIAQISLSAAAKQLNVARSHVARLISFAEKANLLHRMKDGSIQLTETLCDYADSALCLQIVGYAICAAHAYEVIRTR